MPKRPWRIAPGDISGNGVTISGNEPVGIGFTVHRARTETFQPPISCPQCGKNATAFELIHLFADHEHLSWGKQSLGFFGPCGCAWSSSHCPGGLQFRTGSDGNVVDAVFLSDADPRITYTDAKKLRSSE